MGAEEEAVPPKQSLDGAPAVCCAPDGVVRLLHKGCYAFGAIHVVHARIDGPEGWARRQYPGHLQARLHHQAVEAQP